MTDQSLRTSSVKLGLAVSWPAFWTGIPFKASIALLMLAMGVHPWEMPALAFLLLLSIPIDIWALGLSGRTVFLERLRLKPPESIGLTLWWQGALFSAVYLPVAYQVGSLVVKGAKAVTTAIMETELLMAWPIAERISIELVLWGSVATIALILLALGWLYVFGRIVGRQATDASPAHDSYQALIRRWDLLRVPTDQPLMLTVFTASGVLLVLLFWAFLPVMTPHPHEDYEDRMAKPTRPLKPAEILNKTEQVIFQAEAAIAKLEKDKKKSGKKAKK